MKKELKTISNGIIGGIIGTLLVFTINVAAETLIGSETVSYSNSKTSTTTVNGALDELFSAVDINERLDTLYNNRSHIGMIVQSTTLDTMEKVIAIYGGTTWTKIEGRFLLGASSAYTVNSTGGSTTSSITLQGTNSNTGGNGSHTHAFTGTTQSVSTMSPYKAVYIWERTA